MIPGSLPDYVDRGGRQVWRPPYLAHRADVFGFVLECDRAAIDSLLQRDLVEPAGDAVDYRCAQGRIVVMFASIERLCSEDKRDRQRGYVSELEVSVWCLAADVSAGSRLVWYLPYVFVDSGQAAASGREVYGYPKQMGVFEADYPKRLGRPGKTTVQGLAIERYGPNEKAVLRPMLSAERLSPSAAEPEVVGNGKEAFAALLDMFAADLTVNPDLPFGPGPQPSAVITPVSSPPPKPSRPTVPAWAARRVLDSLRGRAIVGVSSDLIGRMVANPTLVFLKQFRDATCPTKACYQAIVEAPLAVDPVGADYMPLNPGQFEITIEDWDSHPIATELGVAPRTPVHPEVAFHAGFDFDIQLGFEVWRAST